MAYMNMNDLKADINIYEKDINIFEAEINMKFDYLESNFALGRHFGIN